MATDDEDDEDDETFLEAVRRLLQGNLVERLRVTDVSVVGGRPWPRVRVDFEEPAAAHGAPLPGSAHLPFSSEWRELSDFDDPVEYARELASAVYVAWHRLPRPGDDAPEPTAEPTEAEVAERWTWFLERLALTGPVTEVARGRLEVQGRQGRTLTVVVTPEQWARIGEPIDPEADDPQDFYSVDDDQVFLVHHEGELVWSIREELPPVRGGQRWRRDTAAARARGEDMSRYGWHAL